MITIKIKNGSGYVPSQGTPLASGYDVIAISPPKVYGIEQTDNEGNILTGKYTRIDFIEYETGLFIAPEEKYHVLAFPRSSISKYDLVLANSVGLLDVDYRGQILFRFKYMYQPCDLELGTFLSSTAEVGTVFLYNPIKRIEMQYAINLNTSKIYKKNDKIGQLVLAERIPAKFEMVEILPESIRGEGGFGSSDLKTVVTSSYTPEVKPSPLAGITGVKDPLTGLAGLYQKEGGVPVKKRYIDEIKERDSY